MERARRVVKPCSRCATIWWPAIDLTIIFCHHTSSRTNSLWPLSAARLWLVCTVSCYWASCLRSPGQARPDHVCPGAMGLIIAHSCSTRVPWSTANMRVIRSFALNTLIMTSCSKLGCDQPGTKICSRSARFFKWTFWIFDAFTDDVIRKSVNNIWTIRMDSRPHDQLQLFR